MTAGDNPFAPGRLERVLAFDPALAGTTWELLEEKWRALGCRAAVTGRRGSGKSALLRAWARRHDDALVLHFNDQHRRPDSRELLQLDACAGRLLLVDGEDFLTWTDRLRLRRAARAARGTLVVRARRGPWPELIRLTSSPDLAFELLRRAAPSHARRFHPGLGARWRAGRGNLRELWLDLYDELKAESFCKNYTDP